MKQIKTSVKKENDLIWLATGIVQKHITIIDRKMEKAYNDCLPDQGKK